MNTIDDASHHAAMLLNVLGAINRRLMDEAIKLRRNPLVKTVVTEWQPYIYGVGQGCMIDGYVDTELKDGSAITWFIALNWTHNKWIVDYRIAGIPFDNPQIKYERGQQTLFTFSDRTATTLLDCIRHLQEAVDELFTQSLEAMIALNQ